MTMITTRNTLRPATWPLARNARPPSRLTTSVKLASARPARFSATHRNCPESDGWTLVSSSELWPVPPPVAIQSSVMNTRWNGPNAVLLASGRPFQYHDTFAAGDDWTRHETDALSPVAACTVWSSCRKMSGWHAKSSAASAENVRLATRPGPEAHAGSTTVGTLLSVSQTLTGRMRQSQCHGFSCSSTPCTLCSVATVPAISSVNRLLFNLSVSNRSMPTNALAAISCSSHPDRSNRTRPVHFWNASGPTRCMGLPASDRSRSSGTSANVAVGTAVSMFRERSISTAFVRPRSARLSIWPIRHRDMYTRCRLSRPSRANKLPGSICRLFPDTSNTCVAASMPDGTVINDLSRHSTLCLPPFHLHWHASGQASAWTALALTTASTAAASHSCHRRAITRCGPSPERGRWTTVVTAPTSSRRRLREWRPLDRSPPPPPRASKRARKWDEMIYSDEQFEILKRRQSRTSPLFDNANYIINIVLTYGRTSNSFFFVHGLKIIIKIQKHC